MITEVTITAKYNPETKKWEAKATSPQFQNPLDWENTGADLSGATSQITADVDHMNELDTTDIVLPNRICNKHE